MLADITTFAWGGDSAPRSDSMLVTQATHSAAED